MAVYKAVADAAERADERLSTFKQMIAEKEAQMAKEKARQPKRRAVARVKVKERP